MKATTASAGMFDTLGNIIPWVNTYQQMCFVEGFWKSIEKYKTSSLKRQTLIPRPKKHRGPQKHTKTNYWMPLHRIFQMLVRDRKRPTEMPPCSICRNLSSPSARENSSTDASRMAWKASQSERWKGRRGFSVATRCCEIDFKSFF